MRLRWLMFAAAVLLLQRPGDAQGLAEGYRPVELFLGYSDFNTGGGPTRNTVNGWQGNIAYNMSRHWSLSGEAAGHYENGQAEHHVMIGPRFNSRFDRINPFAHALVGITRSGSENALILGFGGGADYKLNDRLAIRALQIDWMPNGLFHGAPNPWRTKDIQLGFGVVLGFGP